MTKPRIRVLIVDDSAVVRQTLSEVLGNDPEIEVIATAADPFVATERIREQVPDVITLDIEMPRMDGLTFLQKIMSQHPIPVVICSSLAEEGAQSTFKALEYGAVDIIAKPRLGSKQFLEDSCITICQAVKAAAGARLRPIRPARVVEPKLTADAMLSPATHAMAETTEKVKIAEVGNTGTLFEACFGRIDPVLTEIESMKLQMESDQPELKERYEDRYDHAEVERLFSASYTTEMERDVLRAALRGKALPIARPTFAGNSVELF